MPSKKSRNWLEIKQTKSVEEWRMINRAYDRRRRLKNQLTLKAAELMNEIHDYRMMQTPGPADKLLAEVKRALELPYAWNQEAYDHAVARLEDIAKDIQEIKKEITPKTTQLANAIMMTILNSKDKEDVKAAALISAVQYMANQLSMEYVQNLEESLTNCLMTLLRTKDGYYPSWFPRYIFNSLKRLLNEKDQRTFTGWWDDTIATYDSRDNLLGLLDMQEENEDKAEIR